MCIRQIYLKKCVVLMEAIFPCFNFKPDDCNLATTILVHKLSQLNKTLVLGKLWLHCTKNEVFYYRFLQ